MLLGLGFAVSFGQPEGAQGGAFHLLTHAAMKGLAFLAAGCLLFALRLSRGDSGPLETADLAGAARRYPVIALAFTVALLGLGGLPPLGGFMSKWQIFASGVRTGNPIAIALVVFAVLNSLLSFGYYAPLVSMMYRNAPSADGQRGCASSRRHDRPTGAAGRRRRGLRRVAGACERADRAAGQVVLAIFSRQGGM